jgi:hypothetical protein
VAFGALVGTVATLYARALFAANGTRPGDMLAGKAAWRAAPNWTARLAIGPARQGLASGLGRARAAAASCLPVRRPLPLIAANTDDLPHGRG